MDTELQLAGGYIETFAGNGKARSTGDGKRAVKAGIPLPHHVALDKEEKWLYFAESGSDRIRRVNIAEGTLHNFAGIGETCYSGDEGPCGEAGLYLPLDVAFDSQNNLFICDSGSNRIRKVDRETGIITTVVGTGQHGFNGDGPALEVNLTWPAAIAFDLRGNADMVPIDIEIRDLPLVELPLALGRAGVRVVIRKDLNTGDEVVHGIRMGDALQ